MLNYVETVLMQTPANNPPAIHITKSQTKSRNLHHPQNRNLKLNQKNTPKNHPQNLPKQTPKKPQ